MPESLESHSADPAIAGIRDIAAAMNPTGEYTVEVVREVREVLALRNDWEKMSFDPNGDIDFYLTVINSHDEFLRPHVVVLRQGEIVRCILAGRIERKPLEMALGYRKISTPSVRFLTLVHGGVLGVDSEKQALLLVNSVWESLRQHEADVACFHGVDSPSPFYQVARRAGWAITRDSSPEWLPRWRLRLPETFEELSRGRSANTRHNLRRYSKRLLKEFGDNITVRSLRDPKDLSTILSDIESVAKNTYHRGMGVGFIHDDQTRSLMTLAANQGWLRAHILYIDGKPCAFWNGFLYRRTFFTWTTGYAPSLAEFRPGLFLLQRMLEELCGEGLADEVDFGFGDAQYKRDWCDYEHLQASLLLFAPSVKGIALNCVRSPLVGASNIMRSALARIGLLQKIKKAWRGRLASGMASQGDHGQKNS